MSEATYSPEFAEKLAGAWKAWAENHPKTDDEFMEFIGPDGRMTYSPSQYAKEISDHTPFGQRRIQDYQDISTNLGDASGDRVIQDILDMAEAFKSK